MSICISRRALLFAIALAAGCTSSTEPTLGVPCDGSLTVSVTSGTTPQISWTPVCAANGLSVDVANAVGTTSTTWAITSQSSFGPPVTYGVSPANATAVVALHPLVTGTTYRVTVVRTSGEGVLSSQGSMTFTP